MANPQTKNLDVGGLDSSRLLPTRSGPPERIVFPQKSRLWILSPVDSKHVDWSYSDSFRYSIWSGLVWSGLVWSDPVRSGPIRSGLVRSCPVRSGPDAFAGRACGSLPSPLAGPLPKPVSGAPPSRGPGRARARGLPGARLPARRQRDDPRIDKVENNTTGVCEKTLLLCQTLPCNPAAETALQTLIWCSENIFSRGLSFPEECIFSDAGITNDNNDNNGTAWT